MEVACWLTFEFTGRRGISRRSGGMMGWAAHVGNQRWIATYALTNNLAAADDAPQ